MSNYVKNLVIDEGSEFTIKVEKLVDFNKSFFKDIYDSAAVNVKEILDNTQEYYNKKKNKEFFKDKEEANNIIAFTGERGTGKSSVMISFAEALKTIENSRINLDNQGYKKFRDLKGVEFVNLDIIDPALLEDKESIFEIVIAKMFSKFKEYLEKENGKLEFDDKKRLLKKFQKVYKDLKVINTDRKDFFKEGAEGEDILQTLVSLASGSNMRKSFIELVNEYLRFFSNENNKDRYNDKEKRFLVIPIDDLDMDIRHSAEMAEQIRKYLMIPNLIILMAIKIEQLKDSMEQMYRANYKVMLEAGSLSDDPKEMAERYIEKLIPNGRKLYLPEIRSIKDGRENKINLIFISKKQDEYVTRNEICEIENDNSSNYSGLSIEKAVLKMTYEKTGLIFIKPKYDMHYLVPDNLRELQNYLIMLKNMETVNINYNEKDKNNSKQENEKFKNIKLKNIDKFETYFLKSWVRRNLAKVHIDLIEEFFSTSLEHKNKLVITKIRKIIFEEIKNNLEEKEYENIVRTNVQASVTNNAIFDINNNSINVSLGDVLESLRIYADYDGNNTKKLKFAIKTLYSIILCKLLCMNNYKDLSTLIAGSIFGEKSKEFITGNRGKCPIVDYTDIQIDEGLRIPRIINDLFMTTQNALIKADNINTKMKSYYKEPNKSLQLSEYLYYFLYIGECMTNKKQRIEENAYYIKESGIGSSSPIKNAQFDVTAFTFFLLNPEENLEGLFSCLLGTDIKKTDIRRTDIKDIESIRISLKDNCKEENDDNIKEIFNSKVLEALKEKSLIPEIRSWKEKYNVAVPIYSLEIIEKLISNIGKTSKFKEKVEGNYYSMFYKFIGGIEKCLKNIMKENEFLELQENDNIVDAYVKCPLVEILLNTDLNNDKIIINKEDVRKLIDSVEKNFKKDSNNASLIEILQKQKFHGVSLKKTIKKRLDDLLREIDGQINSENIKNQLDIKRGELDKISEGKGVKEKEKSKAEGLNLGISIEQLIKGEINRIKIKDSNNTKTREEVATTKLTDSKEKNSNNKSDNIKLIEILQKQNFDGLLSKETLEKRLVDVLKKIEGNTILENIKNQLNIKKNELEKIVEGTDSKEREKSKDEWENLIISIKDSIKDGINILENEDES